MNIRMTPIIALATVLGLAACQEEESAEAVDTGETEEIGEEEGESIGTDSVVTEESADAGVSTETVAEDDIAGVEAGSVDAEVAGLEPTTGADDATQDGETPAAAAEAPAASLATEEETAGSDAGEGSLDELLTPEGFDADRIVAEIDNSDLDESRKEELRELTRSAEEDPSQVDAALETLRADLLGEDGADAGDVIGSDRDFAAAPGSLFSPAQFGGASDYAIEGARLAGMSTAIFVDEPRQRAD